MADELVLDVAEVVELEQRIAAAGTPLATLMHRAGRALADTVRAAYPAPGEVVVFAGSGNNGGDGWVAADMLAYDGYRVTLFTPRAATELKAEPARTTALEIMDDGLSVLRVMVAPSAAQVAEALRRANVAIDAMLGTGFSGEALREPYAGWVEALNAAHTCEGGPYVVAADAPSGLSAQTGATAAPCVAADATVTMLARKPGLIAPAAAPYVGKLTCDTLGIKVEDHLSLS